MTTANWVVWVVQSDRVVSRHLFDASTKPTDAMAMAARYGDQNKTIAVLMVEPTPQLLAECWGVKL